MQLNVHGKTAFDIETVYSNLRRIHLRMVGSTSDVSRLLRLVIFILWLKCYLTISFQKVELRAFKIKPHNRINQPRNQRHRGLFNWCMHVCE